MSENQNPTAPATSAPASGTGQPPTPPATPSAPPGPPQPGASADPSKPDPSSPLAVKVEPDKLKKFRVRIWPRATAGKPAGKATEKDFTAKDSIAAIKMAIKAAGGGDPSSYQYLCKEV